MLVVPVKDKLPVDAIQISPAEFITSVEFVVEDEIVPLISSIFDDTTFIIVAKATKDELGVNIRDTEESKTLVEAVSVFVPLLTYTTVAFRTTKGLVSVRVPLFVK